MTSARGSKVRGQSTKYKDDGRRQRERGERAAGAFKGAARSSTWRRARLSACTGRQRAVCNIVHYFSLAVKGFCGPRQGFLENCWSAALTDHGRAKEEKETIRSRWTFLPSGQFGTTQSRLFAKAARAVPLLRELAAKDPDEEVRSAAKAAADQNVRLHRE